MQAWNSLRIFQNVNKFSISHIDLTIFYKTYVHKTLAIEVLKEKLLNASFTKPHCVKPSHILECEAPVRLLGSFSHRLLLLLCYDRKD